MAEGTNTRSLPVVGVNFDEFAERINSLKVRYRDATSGKEYSVGIKYYPGRFNDEAAKKVSRVRMSSLMGNDTDDDDTGGDSPMTSIEFINDQLINVLHEWDMFQGDPANGMRYEPGEIMERVEINFKMAIWEAIQKDMRPGEAKRRN